MIKGGRKRERERARASGHICGGRIGEGMPVVVAGVGTVWRGKGEDRGY